MCLNVPPKIIHFMWRMFSNCLPVMQALTIRNVDVSIMCPMCNQSQESVFHAMVQCPLARAVWRQSPIGDISGSVNSIFSWWRSVVNRFNDVVIVMAATLLWSVWKNHNDWVWNRHRLRSQTIFSLSRRLANDWNDAKVVDSQVVARVQSVPQWVKPPVGFLKCNVDAAIFSEDRKTGFAAVLRDASGNFVAAMRLLGGYTGSDSSRMHWYS
jgi:hypothetical protein